MRFLEEKAQPGRFDSEGHFSVSTELALRKLKDHALVDPSQWVLKLVQAGVAGRADEIAIKAFRNSTRADIVLSDLAPLDTFEGALLRLESARGSLMGELCVGLRALLNQHQFRLLWCDGESAQGFVWDGSELHHAKPHPCSVTSSRLRLEMSGPQCSAASRAEETRLLQERCRWCGVTLTLDGRQVNGPDNLPRSQFPLTRHGTDSPRYLASGWLRDTLPEVEPSDPVSPVLKKGQDVLRAGTPFLHWPRRQTHQFGGGFCLYVSYEFLDDSSPGFLSYFGDPIPSLLNEVFCLGVNRLGVLCGGYESEDFGIGGQVVICGDALATDLVGLNVVPDARWRKEATAVLTELMVLVDVAKDRLLAYERRPRRNRLELASEIGFERLMSRWKRAAREQAASDPLEGRVSVDNHEVLDRLPDWLRENFRRLSASPPPRYWRLIEFSSGGV